VRAFLVLLVAVPLAFLYVEHRDEAGNEARLGEIASVIVGRDVEVHCPSVWARLVDISPNAGSVYFSSDGRPADYTDLNGKTCSTLDDFAERDPESRLDCLVIDRPCGRDVLEIVRAVHVLAHESFHLAGVRSEAVADCYGLQRAAWVAYRLGADPPEARALAALDLEDRTLAAPPDYRSSECREGGELDLNPDGSPWP
jgi:hypothetical protein